MIKQQEHELSERQMAILVFIYEYQVVHGFVPSIREIAKAIGTSSTSAVNYQINSLVQLGYISKVNEVSRGLHPPTKLSAQKSYRIPTSR